MHSPSLFYLVRMIVYDDNAYYAFPLIEQQRARLLRSAATLQQQDYGTGATALPDGTPPLIQRRVADIARTHLESPKVAQLLFRFVNYLSTTQQQPLTIVELGSSLGVTTAYLAAPSARNRVLTFEGAPEILDEAMQVWRELHLTNIEPVLGNINDTLPANCPERIDLAFIDANHSYEATMRYFRQLLPAMQQRGIVVLDDIYHSPEMTRVWQDIQSLPQVTTTIDCYHIGIVLFNPYYLRKHYKIRI